MNLNVEIKLDERRVYGKVHSNRFGKYVALEWKRLIDPYTPRDTGMLQTNIRIEPFRIEYKSPYAHYMYEGEIYVDPELKVGGFYSSTYGWFSRPNVKKIPSGRSFNYSKSKNPSATDHWDEVAAKSGQLNKLYQTLNNALQNGNF